jgi:hypothetical protein
MIPRNELNLFKEYVANTPRPLQSTRGWSKYLRANAGPAGAYDAALRRRKTLPTFEQMYGVRLGPRGETIALDQHGNGPPPGPMHEDEHLRGESGHAPPDGRGDRPSSDAEPVDHEGYPSGRAPPFGPHDEPRMAQDPIQSERQRRAMGAAASGHSRLGIPPSVGERFLHGDQIETELPSERTREPATVRAGQQGDQAEHEDEPQDEKLIRRVLKKLGFEDDAVEEAIARDRAGRRRMAGDAALSRRSFYQMFPEARGLADGLPAFVPRVLW